MIMTTPTTLAEILAQVEKSEEICEKATAELAHICKNPKYFRMCIPPQDDDSDLIISSSFDSLKAANATIKLLCKALEMAAMPWSINVPSSTTSDEDWDRSIQYYIDQAARELEEEKHESN